MTESDIKALFSPFGAVMKIDISIDYATNRSKGYCFLEFQDPDSAIAALEMNGFEIGTRKIKVGRPANITTTTTSGSVSVTGIGSSSGVPTTATTSMLSDAKLQAQMLLAQAMGFSSSTEVTKTIPSSLLPLPLLVQKESKSIIVRYGMNDNIDYTILYCLLYSL